ncbi:uncharacterized protein BJ171DRAFT_497218 [Polychytrium aggregatum]|uniref:uncharacterized protein n=1 Tax=Polychytrium aggregatum TaxID=110093 RepID=UPI0022FE7116|nr:uncharacterized protein BJ171DRAFT_497218 [Polychytrium aggregatum]KAI9206312.1 hypothetical protein BJ171DRAFT_497218 [Polychytrium aggregatum]
MLSPDQVDSISSVSMHVLGHPEASSATSVPSLPVPHFPPAMGVSPLDVAQHSAILGVLNTASSQIELASVQMPGQPAAAHGPTPAKSVAQAKPIQWVNFDPGSSKGKARRRTTPEQLNVLEDSYKRNNKPNLNERQKLAHDLQLTNRRAKDKKASNTSAQSLGGSDSKESTPFSCASSDISEYVPPSPAALTTPAVPSSFTPTIHDITTRSSGHGAAGLQGTALSPAATASLLKRLTSVSAAGTSLSPPPDSTVALLAASSAAAALAASSVLASTSPALASASPVSLPTPLLTPTPAPASVYVGSFVSVLPQRPANMEPAAAAGVCALSTRPNPDFSQTPKKNRRSPPHLLQLAQVAELPMSPLQLMTPLSQEASSPVDDIAGLASRELNLHPSESPLSTELSQAAELDGNVAVKCEPPAEPAEPVLPLPVKRLSAPKSRKSATEISKRLTTRSSGAKKAGSKLAKPQRSSSDECSTDLGCSTDGAGSTAATADDGNMHETKASIEKFTQLVEGLHSSIIKGATAVPDPLYSRANIATEFEISLGQDHAEHNLLTSSDAVWLPSTEISERHSQNRLLDYSAPGTPGEGEYAPNSSLASRSSSPIADDSFDASQVSSIESIPGLNDFLSSPEEQGLLAAAKLFDSEPPLPAKGMQLHMPDDFDYRPPQPRDFSVVQRNNGSVQRSGLAAVRLSFRHITPPNRRSSPSSEPLSPLTSSPPVPDLPPVDTDKLFVYRWPAIC